MVPVADEVAVPLDDAEEVAEGLEVEEKLEMAEKVDWAV